MTQSSLNIIKKIPTVYLIQDYETAGLCLRLLINFYIYAAYKVSFKSQLSKREILLIRYCNSFINCPHLRIARSALVIFRVKISQCNTIAPRLTHICTSKGRLKSTGRVTRARTPCRVMNTSSNIAEHNK